MSTREDDDTGRRWWTTRGGAARATVHAAIRGALRAQRDRLATPCGRPSSRPAAWPRTNLVTLEAARLARRGRSYDDVVGATAPDATTWCPPPGWRAHERSVRLGAGPALWEHASSEVLRWGVKTRSGFLVAPDLEPDAVAHAGDRFWLTAQLGPWRIREPVEVVATVDTPDRAALAYGTLVGHPVRGEEAFIVERDVDSGVTLTLRSLTRAGRGRWRVVFPAALVAQRWYRRRYLRAPAVG